jgi:hypothetical protein
MVREWAEVPYVPSRKVECEDAPVYLYMALPGKDGYGHLKGSCGRREPVLVTLS